MLRVPRPAPYLAAALALAAALPAAASGAEFYAAPGGSDGPCAEAGTPCGITAALSSAAQTPGGDVVNLAAGMYTDGIVATDPSLDGVTLRGAGKRATFIAAIVNDAPAVDLGSAGSGSMALEDLAIDSPLSGAFSSAVRSRLARLTMTRVRILHTYGPSGKAVAAIDAGSASSQLVLDAVDVSSDTEAYDPAIGTVTAGGPLTIRDSTIRGVTPGATDTVVARGDVTILRSTLIHGEVNAGNTLLVSSPDAARTVVIDSSLVRGGNTSVRLDVGTAGSNVLLRGVTLAPSWNSNGWSVDLNGEPGSAARVWIDNSVLLTRPVRASGSAQATCSWSNVSPDSEGSGNQDCSGAEGNAGSNTALRDDQLLLDKDYAPRADSPLVDAGSPGGVGAGESPTDRLGRPRAAASDDVCNAGPGRRDKGAFERYRPNPSVTIVSADRFPAGTPVQFSATTNALDPFFVWSFGDETSGVSAQTTSHSFASGRGKVTLEVTDRAYGCSARTTKDVTATTVTASGAARDSTRPRLTKVSLVRARIKRRKNAALRFTLSEAATVTVTVARRKGKKLVATRRLTVKGRRGANRATLTAKRMGLHKAARFRVRLTAKDAAGNSATAVARNLTVR